MTKREKIIKYLVDGGVREDLLRLYEDKRWPKSGTIVLSGILPDDWLKIYFDLYKDKKDSPIEVHQIRDHFEWKYGCYRVSWVGD